MERRAMMGRIQYIMLNVPAYVHGFSYSHSQRRMICVLGVDQSPFFTKSIFSPIDADIRLLIMSWILWLKKFNLHITLFATQILKVRGTR